jgi:hypothetical protein
VSAVSSIAISTVTDNLVYSVEVFDRPHGNLVEVLARV